MWNASVSLWVSPYAFRSRALASFDESDSERVHGFCDMPQLDPAPLWAAAHALLDFLELLTLGAARPPGVSDCGNGGGESPRRRGDREEMRPREERATPGAPPSFGGEDAAGAAREAARAALRFAPGGGGVHDADVDELANLLMSWYYAGYYTGSYSRRPGGGR